MLSNGSENHGECRTGKFGSFGKISLKLNERFRPEKWATDQGR